MDSFITLYILVALVFLLAGEMVVAIFAIYRLTKKITQLKQKELNLKDNFSEQEEEILRQAQDKAVKIVNQAVESSAKLQKDAQLDKEKLQELLIAKLDQVALQVINRYETDLNKQVAGNIEKYQSLSKSLELKLNDHLGQYTKVLDQQTIASEKLIAEKLETAYKAETEKINQYRQAKMAEVDQQIVKIVRQTTEEAIGQSLSIDEHQDLIIEALEKAKKEGTLKA